MITSSFRICPCGACTLKNIPKKGDLSNAETILALTGASENMLGHADTTRRLFNLIFIYTTCLQLKSQGNKKTHIKQDSVDRPKPFQKHIPQTLVEYHSAKKRKTTYGKTNAHGAKSS